MSLVQESRFGGSELPLGECAHCLQIGELVESADQVVGIAMRSPAVRAWNRRTSLIVFGSTSGSATPTIHSSPRKHARCPGYHCCASGFPGSGPNKAPRHKSLLPIQRECSKFCTVRHRSGQVPVLMPSVDIDRSLNNVRESRCGRRIRTGCSRAAACGDLRHNRRGV